MGREKLETRNRHAKSKVLSQKMKGATAGMEGGEKKKERGREREKLGGGWWRVEEKAGTRRELFKKKGLRAMQGEHVKRWRERKTGEKKSETERGEVKEGGISMKNIDAD